MPFMDGTGPLGNGPGSGRGRGLCPGPRRGFGQGAGFGGRNRLSFNPQGASDAKESLTQQASVLEQQLERIKQQISRLEGEGPAPR